MRVFSLLAIVTSTIGFVYGLIDFYADALAEADVIFLGEQHDSAEGHAVQLALTKAVAERRGEIVLSMEMLERDSQRLVDMYLDMETGASKGRAEQAVELCKECIQWATEEKRIFLRQVRLSLVNKDYVKIFLTSH